MPLFGCSLKTVGLTMWGTAAEGVGRELEELAESAPVLAISACKVSSYNGVSGALKRQGLRVAATLPACCLQAAVALNQSGLACTVPTSLHSSWVPSATGQPGVLAAKGLFKQCSSGLPL